jgi:hypothetical protein
MMPVFHEVSRAERPSQQTADFRQTAPEIQVWPRLAGIPSPRSPKRLGTRANRAEALNRKAPAERKLPYRGLTSAKVRGSIYSLYSPAEMSGLAPARTAEFSVVLVAAGAARYGVDWSNSRSFKAPPSWETDGQFWF